MARSEPCVHLDWPLMRENILREDLDSIIRFLSQDPAPILTQSSQVRAFEEEWSAWLGVRQSVFVNSGSSANLVTMCALRHLHGPGKVIVPTLTWVSDIASVIQAGFEPVFVDIHPQTLGMDVEQVLAVLDEDVRGVFLTHILGFNALNERLLEALESRGIPLIEDVCESHGATFQGRKLGTFGLCSNFSFYYAHHLSTIEGGMICSNDDHFIETIRMLRSHGMVREMRDAQKKSDYAHRHPDLNPDFIFSFPAYNVRSTEINAVIGRNQLPRLDANNVLRRRNFERFLAGLDPTRYRTDFFVEGSSNYAFTLVLREPDDVLRDRVQSALRKAGVEFRRGTSGGGNQLRQPYLRERFGEHYKDFPMVDHVHFYGFYIGNYPDLDPEKIGQLCHLLNAC
ncbi:MAG: DegT/DnrJ/EryC1/StrS aminotransferase family protein [Chthoniobacterales bacterium]|nr:DegT/DnrJ/EryC1/StrS aminotransferase family protein [Chthoniobacterales bacterium]